MKYYDFMKKCVERSAEPEAPQERIKNLDTLVGTMMMFCKASKDADYVKRALFYGKAKGVDAVDPDKVKLFLDKVANDKRYVQLLHGLLGSLSEFMEIIQAENDEQLDEEIGDFLFYSSVVHHWACEILGCSKDVPLINNDRKLALRYGDKFTEQKALLRPDKNISWLDMVGEAANFIDSTADFTMDDQELFKQLVRKIEDFRLEDKSKITIVNKEKVVIKADDSFFTLWGGSYSVMGWPDKLYVPGMNIYNNSQ